MLDQKFLTGFPLREKSTERVILGELILVILGEEWGGSNQMMLRRRRGTFLDMIVVEALQCLD